MCSERSDAFLNFFNWSRKICFNCQRGRYRGQQKIIPSSFYSVWVSVWCACVRACVLVHVCCGRYSLLQSKYREKEFRFITYPICIVNKFTALLLLHWVGFQYVVTIIGYALLEVCSICWFYNKHCKLHNSRIKTVRFQRQCQTT